ncbi:PDR/VanB family oxidoreductase [Pseudomonas putida]|uniref:PDR/VanB family oxidoreductase n=1 Tax=Pseudomonas putida TaxID=303 RepID=UPI00226EC11D|nr:PDR/VanB family oxidoreductase [Pseudomonas putida]WAB99264.1 PDR/VanB family oxidoreductase [Pseudomonas putida]
MISVEIIARKAEAQNIYSFELVSATGDKLPAFSAGSHIDVHLPGGLVRQYSLYNNAQVDKSYKIAVLLAPDGRGGSAAMHQLQVGQVINVSQPRNLFPLCHEAKKTLLFAGGIGITPILCMAERLAHINADFELHYYSRSRDHAAFAEQLEQCSFAERVHLYFDSEPATKPDLADKLANPSMEHHLFVCGPTGFMNYVLGTAADAGWADHQLHREYFANEAGSADGNQAFDVTIASTQEVLHVPADKSILQVLQDNNIDIPYSCEQGVCGTCLVRVLEGVPDHRDLYLSTSEKSANDQILTCCSRAGSNHLVLDL